MTARISSRDFFRALRWIDGRPLVVEPYRERIFTAVLDEVDETGAPRYNLALTGRAKKNAKTLDVVLAALFCLVANDSPGGNQGYLLANDEGQAGDDLSLAKKLVAANPLLADRLVVRQKTIERADGRGFLEILPAGDVAGTHGKTYRFCGFDEIHGYRTWDLLEAMQLDPTRLDALMWITSYASIHHRPGVPLFDLCSIGRAGTDARMHFSWYAADYTTDDAFKDADPETRANPSRGTWADQNYLAQQQRRLPAHKYRRLHLNLPGLPEGSAFQAEPVMDAVVRGVAAWGHEPDMAPERLAGYVDMSGGSNDDATCAVALATDEGVVVLSVINQGPPPPFDPSAAVARFAEHLRRYGLARVSGDAYAGETFRRAFEAEGIAYDVIDASASKLYEALEPLLNAGEVLLPDVPVLEQQFLSLVWRGSKITHLGGEHDDWANAASGAVYVAAARQRLAPAAIW